VLFGSLATMHSVPELDLAKPGRGKPRPYNESA